MLEFYFKTDQDDEFQLLSELKPGCWIHVDEAGPEDITALSHLLQVDYADLHDCLDKYEVPRIERVKQNILIFTRHPTEYEIGLYTSTLAILLTPDYFITISPHKVHLVKNFLLQKTPLASSDQSKLLMTLLVRITQEFTARIRKVRHSVLRQEKEMISVESEDITTLTKNEEVLNQYLSALQPMHGVLEAIISRRFTTLYEKEQQQLEDLLHAVKQSEDLCSISIKSIRSLRDSYQIIFTNNLHKTIKLLTGLTIIFNIPTIIASLFGMNVPIPFVGSGQQSFLVISLFTLLLIAFVWGIFKRKRWL